MIISEVVVVIVKFEMHSQPYWNNYFNSGRYFKSGCDVKLSLKFILNHYWNNYFNSGRYFNGGCNKGCFLPNLHSWHWTSGSRDKEFTDRRQAIRKSSHFSFQLSWAKKGEKSTNFYLNLAQCKLMYPQKKRVEPLLYQNRNYWTSRVLS